ncbi:hypothetical protein [Rhizobium sp. RAF56]|uniref:hypothetical protein n=1 Tax=Rhizobium sp. RAF56 TaxID=3233062 RepID=UPI003F94E9DD
MRFDTRHRLYGHTIAEHIKTVAEELPIDAVGLWQIVPAGRYGFDLSGGELAEFVQRCVTALLERGAKPVMGGGGTKYDWILQPQYGETNEEVANAVLREWLDAGARDTDPGGLWFALLSPHVGTPE